MNYSKHNKDSEIEERIENEIIVDCYDEYEELSGWYCYLEDNLSFPFEAVCEKKSLRSPLKVGEKLKAIKLADIDECGVKISAIVKWQDREFAVPLEQLKVLEEPNDLNEDFLQAMEDWKYWVSVGGFC